MKEFTLVKQDTNNSKVNIGKATLQNIDLNSYVINKDKNKFKLTSKNQKNPTFTGTPITDQTACYLLMNIKKDSNSIEVMQINQWYQFLKDSKDSETAEEIEEKIKKQNKESQILENIINNKAKAQTKETKESKKLAKGNPTTNKHYVEENIIVKSDDEEAFKLNKKKRKNSDDSLLNSVPSDLEKIITTTNQNKDSKEKFENLKKELEEEDESSDSNTNDLFGEKINDKQTSKISESDEDLTDFDAFESKHNFIGKKRENEGNITSMNKVSLEEEINRILLRTKSITYDNIKKELSKSNNFTINEISDNLNLILDKVCSKFKNSEGTEFFCRKIKK